MVNILLSLCCPVRFGPGGSCDGLVDVLDKRRKAL